MDASGQLSITHLILNASALVQIVMLFLLGLSVFSWTIIISKSNSYKAARAKADEFEDKFWSGIDLNNLYQECIKKGQDLIGLEVIDFDTGKKYGTLSDVSETGANDVYHIKGQNGKETLIAAVPSVVIQTDITEGIMKIRPLEGTFEDED